MSVGSDVAAARRAAGLSIEDVSAATRVRATVVRAIEVDDFSHCGGRVYARGHLRAICHTVGLDDADILVAFDREQGEPEPPPVSAPAAGTYTHEARRINWSLTMAVALVAVLGFVGFRFLTVGGDAASGSSAAAGAAALNTSEPTTSDSATTDSATTDSVTTDPTTEPRTTEQATPDALLPTDAVAAGPAVQMVVSTDVARSWLQVTGSDGVIFAGVLEKGASRRFVDNERIAVVIGNAGAVTLKVNGEDLGSVGSSGQVARLTFGPGNPNQG